LKTTNFRPCFQFLKKKISNPAHTFESVVGIFAMTPTGPGGIINGEGDLAICPSRGSGKKPGGLSAKQVRENHPDELFLAPWTSIGL